ncbi:MAG: hypothetical protein LBD64_05230, partial [Odoribacteraceae bacterium]|nr:hypothetical protein [Odoribacteraceae bacterium]
KSPARVQQGFPPGESLSRPCNKVSPRGKVSCTRATGFPPGEVYNKESSPVNRHRARRQAGYAWWISRRQAICPVPALLS